MARLTSITKRQFTVTAPDQSLERIVARLTFVIGTGFDNVVYAIAVQPDGKIVVGGLFSTYNGVTQNRITRLNADGTRDTSFTIGTGFNQEVLAIAIQSDGKIVVGGFFTTYSGTTQRFIARLNTDGTRDTGFRGYEVGILNFNGAVRAIAIQSDGKILVGGSFNTASGTTSSYIARLNADGSSDTSFTTAGTGISDPIRAIAIQSDGKILVGGDFSTYNGVTQNRITRLNADGTRDTGFTIGTGFNLAGGGGTVNDIAIQSDGKIVVVGNFNAYNDISQNRIVRLNSSGTLEAGLDSFGFNIGNGFTGSLLQAYAVAIQPDEKIVVGGGFIQLNGFTVNRIARLNANGTRDTNFVMNSGVNSVSRVYALAVQPDGNILIGGDFTFYNSVSQNRITRLLTSGGQQPTTLPGST